MRRSLEDHRVQPWRVHDVAADFDVLDVWRYPVRVNRHVPLAKFMDFLTEMHDEMREGRSAAAQLFRLRRGLGRIFGWDRESPVAKTPPTGRTFLGFDAVYEADDEVLFGLENATVEALVHLGRVPLEDREGEGAWSPQMAIYVKRKGVLGRFYMTLISPFRHYIVYPTMMRAAERSWPGFAEREGLL